MSNQWMRQQPGQPLFPDLIWSRPQNKNGAGKLLIIGGQAGNFMNVSSAYSFAKEAGAGTIRLLLPDSLRKIASNIEGAEFASTNSSGSFAKTALANFFDLSEWADRVLLAGDLGKNTETTIILDGFLLRGMKPVLISQPALESIGVDMNQLVNMPITLVIERKVFQKIAIATGSHTAVTSSTTYAQRAEIIQNISARTKASYLIIDEEHTWSAADGRTVSTQTKPLNINALSAFASVWLMQNSSKPLEALTTAVFETITV